MATATPTSTTTVTSNIPDWMQPYAQQMLGRLYNTTGAIDPATGKPYLGLAEQGYQQYQGQMLAGFNPLQEQAFKDIAAMGVSPQIAQATGLAGLAGLRAQEASKYGPMQGMDVSYLGATAGPLQQYQMGPAQQVTAAGAYTPDQIQAERVASTYNYDPERVREQRLKEYRMGPAALVGAQQFGLGAAAQYMSPYMQDVVEQQKRQAVQDYARQIPGLQAAGIRSGARGGTREALVESEARRNLAQQLGGIEATGRQSAYQQAMQQYNVDQAQRMQAELANQAAIQDVARQNLQAAMGIQSLGAGQNLQAQLANQAAFQKSAEFGSAQQMQAALANQQAALQAAQLNQAAKQRASEFGAGQGMQAALANQQAGLTVGQQNLAAQLGVQQLGAQQSLAAQQANQQAQLQAQQQALAQRQTMEASRQFGANLGMQGIQQQLAAAGQLGSLGQQQYQQGLGINAAQLQAGAQIQALAQQDLANRYQEFINQQQFPYKQMEFASNILRGIPASGSTSTLYQAPGSTIGQIAGLAGGIGSLFGGFGGTSTTGATTSDRRLKSNIVRVGTHPLGIGVYEYDIWGMRQRGVMADEVLSVMPEAVTMQDNGYMAVFYDKIGGV